MTLLADRPSTEALDHAATLLGRAFLSDPMFVTTFTDPVRRAAGMPLVFRAMTRQAAAHGRVDTEEQGRGVACWVPGDAATFGPSEIVRYGYLRFGLAAGVVDALRLGRIQDRIMAEHHEIASMPHVYLMALGVDPAHQGQGVGSRLLARGCARADEQGLPAFLETNLPQNVRLYERFGFEVRKHLPNEPSKPFDTWLMLRPAPDA